MQKKPTQSKRSQESNTDPEFHKNASAPVETESQLLRSSRSGTVP
jgi:hypothetical protein